VAAYLCVGRRFVYRLTEEHRVRFVIIEGQPRFTAADVADYLARETKDVVAEAARRRGGRPRRSSSWKVPR
jgi:excisionase family DNA binding protein